MRQVLTKLQADLTWFVEDRDSLVMVLSCTDTEVPYVAKVFDLVTAELDGDLFLLFAHNVEPDDDAHTYLTRIIENVEVQRVGANEMRAAEGLEAWPDLPDACHDTSHAPSRRVIALLHWLRERVPDTEHTIVLGLIPVRLGNHAAYASAVQGLLPRDEVMPWMAGCRLLFRDDRAAPALVPHVERHPSDLVVLYEGLDLSPGALTQSLVEQMEDPDVPEEERVVAMMQLAGLDFSHRRYADSYAKWGAVFEYYRAREVPQMQGLALCGAADVLRATGKLPEAKERYQQGLAYCKEPEHIAVTLNLLLGVGEACIALEQWEEAEGYLELAEKIAATRKLLYTQCDVMARRGVPLIALGRIDDAYKLWRVCVDVSRVMKYYERCKETLGSLVALLQRRKMPGEVRKHEAELREVEREEEAAKAEAEAA